MSAKRIVALISGRGSNLEALLAAHLPATISAVVSNVPAVRGLSIAQAHSIAARVVDHRGFADRTAFEHALASEIDQHRPDLIVLAGFMRVLTEPFVKRYAGRMLNIHPSLLPAFAGLNTHRLALEAGVRIHGCTVHFVTGALDNGPIVAQAAVPVLETDTEETLATRVLAQEHRIYPQVIRWFCEDRLRLAPDGRVQIERAPEAAGALLSPATEG